MSQTILYYPKININDGQWLRNALLYWDNISSIVPYEFYDDISPELAFLQKCGVYKPVYPQNLFYSDYADDFVKDVKKRISRYEKYLMRKSVTSSRAPYNHNKKDYTSKEKVYAPILSEMIHYNKLPVDILEFFKNEKFVYNCYYGGWLEIDRNISHIYMKTLAEYSIKNAKNDTVLGTDSSSAIGAVYPYSYGKKHTKCYSINIKNCLPMPSMETSFEEILDFKEKYRDELYEFRKVLRSFEEKIHNAQSEEELRFYEAGFVEDLEKGTKNSHNFFRSVNISFVLGSICSIVSVPLIDSALKANIESGTYNYIKNGTAFLSLTTRFLNHFGKTNPFNEKNAFAYILKGKQKGIISD